jgi:hypothetical protein
MAIVYRFRFRVRRRTTANWGSSNEVLLDSEIGIESNLLRRSKMGDGVTGWNSLLFYTPGLYDLTGIADGYSLFWDASAGNWIVGPPGGGGGSPTAQDVSFEPSSSTALVATNVQDAIEELENDRLAAESALQTSINAKAPLASPTFTGNPTAPTPSVGDNDTSIATTAFVAAAVAAAGSGSSDSRDFWLLG